MFGFILTAFFSAGRFPLRTMLVPRQPHCSIPNSIKGGSIPWRTIIVPRASTYPGHPFEKANNGHDYSGRQMVPMGKNLGRVGKVWFLDYLLKGSLVGLGTVIEVDGFNSCDGRIRALVRFV